jgi:GNAT superfamily N-acetyltransferase
MPVSNAATIVRATEKEIDLLAGLIRTSFVDVARRFGLTSKNCPKHPSNYTSQWVERDLIRGVQYFILVADGTAAGCVGLEQATPQTCYLERLAVLPEHRGRGLGTHLARHALDQAKALGASQVGIGIIAADTGLKRFYESLGFEAGETKTFAHLPFEVAFMHISV